MKQFEFEYTNDFLLEQDLRKMKLWCNSNIVSETVFHIFTEKLNSVNIEHICNMIKDKFPHAKYIGCSTNGNVFNGSFTKKDTIICTVFEYMSTKVDVLQYNLTDETEQVVTDSLIEYVAQNPWVKAIEFVTTIRGMSMTKFCKDLSKIPLSIQIFGGGAFAEDLNNDSACVFSNHSKEIDHSVAFLLIGGDDFFIETGFIAGWKPLGRELQVTKTNGSELIELDGKPAYEIYYRYLKIKNDEHFFKNTLEFPFFYNHSGINILRAPVASTERGSLIMTSDIEENVKARMAYGDPWTILEAIKEHAQKYADFIPESIAIFSCAGRRSFWGDKEVSKELMPFQQLASTYGFYTSSEFQRTNGEVIQHNVTLAIAVMREGTVPSEAPKAIVKTEDDLQGGASMINRLTNFIQASTEELEEAIEMLKKSAITDGMTGLYNRKEIQRQIVEAIQEKQTEPISLIMMDIDNFKHINDTYGHAEGDNVLIALSNMITSNITEHAPEYKAGRWGGEEFMILCPNTALDFAIQVAELIRTDFAELVFEQADQCTMSLGVVEVQNDDTPDNACKKVDDALYTAKATGKNKVVVAE